MTDKDIAFAAQRLTRDLMAYHGIDADTPEAKRNAVVVKCVALLALAFDLPPTREEARPDYDDVLSKLRNAIVKIHGLDEVAK